MVSLVRPLISASASLHSASARRSLSVSCAFWRATRHANATIKAIDQKEMKSPGGSQSKARAAPRVATATSP